RSLAGKCAISGNSVAAPGSAKRLPGKASERRGPVCGNGLVKVSVLRRSERSEVHGKWKVHLLFFMARGVRRHGRLLAYLPNVSKKVTALRSSSAHSARTLRSENERAKGDTICRNFFRNGEPDPRVGARSATSAS